MEETNNNIAETPRKKARLAAETEIKLALLQSVPQTKQDDFQYEVLEDLQFSFQMESTEELAMLRDSIGDPVAARGDTKVFCIPAQGEFLMNLSVRKSNIYVERDCYSKLYDVLMSIWTAEGTEGTSKEKIILTGNSGVGKSWFQVYMLRRLLNDCVTQDNPHFRFVLRQVGLTGFSLLDLQTCRLFKAKVTHEDMKGSLKAMMVKIQKALYLFEPLEDTNAAPTLFAGAGLSTLSPYPKRIKEYRKNPNARFLYMPVWEKSDLELVMRYENSRLQLNENFDFEQSYAHFGGVIRRTLEYDEKRYDNFVRDINDRCEHVDIDQLRSISSEIDEDQNNRSSISGYVACYTKIPQDGNKAFQTRSLKMSSEYVRIKIRERLQLIDPREHAGSLLKCLAGSEQDLTGYALEVTSAHLIAMGPMKVQWDYCLVGGANFETVKLPITKKEIWRRDMFETEKLNYPTRTNFPLVDFFTSIGNVCWAFQTTWQLTHDFKLCTLKTFRDEIGATFDQELNIVFIVPPSRYKQYKARPKDAYLSKNENPNSAIYDPNNETSVVMVAADVKRMWDNTNICVAQPKEAWPKAIQKFLEIESSEN